MSKFTSSPARLEAFSDGVIAVIITIMVLELKVPTQNGLAGLLAILPTLAIYLLSFTFTGIYWKEGETPPAPVLAGVQCGVQK